MSSIVGLLYPACLLVLLVVPLLVKWRWGVAASLLATVAELAGVVALWAVVPPADPSPIGSPGPGESPLLQIRRSQAAAYASFIVLVVLPGGAALIGGALSLAWWGVARLWRALRQPN